MELLASTPSGDRHGEPGIAASRQTRRWALEFGRHGIAFTASREIYPATMTHRLVSQRPDRFRASAAIVAAFGGALGLILIGATAGKAWSSSSDHHAAMLIPAARPYVAPIQAIRPVHSRHPSLGRQRGAATVEDEQAGAPLHLAADGPSQRAGAIATAFRTGDFQEWTDTSGTTGFAVAGPIEASGASSCRAIAVLLRRPGSADSVSNERVCEGAAQASGD